MSYDMSFWKQKTEIKKTNNEIYRILSGGEEIDGLCELPVSDIRNDYDYQGPIELYRKSGFSEVMRENGQVIMRRTI